MTIFLCEPGYTGILSGIYDAGAEQNTDAKFSQAQSSFPAACRPCQLTLPYHMPKASRTQGLFYT